MAISFTVNGTPQSVDVPNDTPLLWVLRDTLQLTGTKFGCGVASCGACTVTMNGVATRSCSMPIEFAEGAEITTIEGAGGPVAEAVQTAWKELDVVQCGYCQSGQIMQAIDLLSQNAKPTTEEIEAAMDGNLCRCATYQRIRAAVTRASEILEA